MSEFFQRLIQDFSVLKGQLTNSVRDGTVKEVKGDKIKVVIGLDADGKDVLSPWIHTTDFRGGSRQRRFWEEGQNVRIFNPSGDWRQAIILPGAPNKKHKKPEHNKDDEHDKKDTYQLEKFNRETKEGEDTKWHDEKSKARHRFTAEKGIENHVDDEDIGNNILTKLGLKSWAGKLGDGKFDIMQDILKGKGILSHVDSGDILNKIMKGEGITSSIGAGNIVQKLIKGEGITSLVEGGKNQLKLLADGLTAKMGDLSQFKVGLEEIQSKIGEVTHSIGADKILSKLGGVEHLVSAAGNLFKGGTVSHDGVNIGKDHIHQLLGRFGGMTTAPMGFGGGGPGGGDGGGWPGGGEAGNLDTLMPFCTGRFWGAGLGELPDALNIQPLSSLNVAQIKLEGPGQWLVIMDATDGVPDPLGGPPGSTEYTVWASFGVMEGGLDAARHIRHQVLTPTSFRLWITDADDAPCQAHRVQFMVYA